MNINQIFDGFYQSYSYFKNNVKETLNALSNLKIVKHETEIKDLIALNTENLLFQEFLFFTNFSKSISLNIDYIFKNNKYILTDLNEIRINQVNNKNMLKNIFKIMINMQIYLLGKIENIIAKNLLGKEEGNLMFPKIEEINQNYQVLVQIVTLIGKLYKEKIYQLNDVLLFFDIIIIFINKNSINDDKYIKIKNKILLNLLVKKYLGYFLPIILSEDNDDDINLFFNYMLKVLNSDEINSSFNFKILTEDKIIEKIISFLSNNINYNKSINIYNKYKNEMIDCFAKIYKNNTDQFQFFEILINQNKKSFINLVNYQTRKDFIIKDLYIQNFYLELLNKLFSIEKKTSQMIKAQEHYFQFNGFNSKMTFNLNNFSLNKTILFFSFRLSKDVAKVASKIFPLIYFHSQSDKETTFKLYIQNENNNFYKLYLSQKVGNKKKENICLDKLENIQLDMNYLISMKFSDKKLGIYINKLIEKSEIKSQEIEIFEMDKETPIFKIGHDDERKEYFKGYFGAFIIMKNISIKKHNKININEIINSILDLKNLYKYFPLLFSESSLYNFDEKIFFSSVKEEYEINEIKKFLTENIENIKCNLYLTPEILELYYSMILKNENIDNYNLPEIPNITSEQEKYKIIDMNISLRKNSFIYIDFLINNGFDYFILIYEYYYNLLKFKESNTNEFDFYSSNKNLENIIIESIKFTLLILYENYTGYKNIILYHNKYKTLFRNLYEILKVNSNNANIMNGISKELYTLFFEFKNELNKFRNEFFKNADEKSFLENEKIILNFSDGLIEMIFDSQLYLNSKDKNNFITLFHLLKKIVQEYMHSNPMNIEFPFQKGFFYNIIHFIKALENLFVNDYNNNNIAIKSYFALLKEYLEAIDNKITRQNYFRNLLIHVFKIYPNNLMIIINFLNFTNEMIWKNYSLESEDIELLFDFYSNKNEEIQKEKDNNNNSKLMENIHELIFNIFAKLYFVDNSSEIINNLNSNSNFEQFIYSDINFSNVISQLKKIFDYFLKMETTDENKIENQPNNKINHMEIFRNIFNFILELFKNIINFITQSSKENKEKFDINKENDKFSQLINLLDEVCEKLKSENKKGRKNKNYLYCLINHLIFYYRFVFSERKILLYSDLKFIENLEQVLDLCDIYYLINCNKLFEFKISERDYHKTIIEIIYEIVIRFFLNDENSEKCYDLLLQKFNFIIFDRNTMDERHSIFYVNDYLRYCSDKKKTTKIENNLKYKLGILEKYNNEFFIGKDKTIGNMLTYFLPIIIETQKQIIQENQTKISIAPFSKLSKHLDELLSLMIEEHSNLYNLDNKYFFKAITDNTQQELLNNLKEKYIKKKSKPTIDEMKKNIELIIEKSRKEKIKAANIVKQNSDERKVTIEPKKSIIEKNDIICETPKSHSNIKFFYDLDKNYIMNIKKGIMNCVFSFYYLDELFYSQDFCIIKKYYINKYLTKKENINNINTKKLNFPSILKNYRNNFEPPLFIKKFNNYTVDPYFPITHSYIKNEVLKKNLTMEKSIKLFQKDIFESDNDEEIECELIKNEKPFFGKLYYNNTNKYLLFKEQEIYFTNEEGFEHIFLLSNLEVNTKTIKEKHKKFFVKNYNKNVLMLFDDIEEIVEMRIFLLWKGFEIYLKNGKSYIFNFLTTKDYDKFAKNFLDNNKLKNLFRKRNFLSDRNIITKYWVERLLSNYEYLLILNRYSSRSFNDPTQYPVFPWILNDYKNLVKFIKGQKDYMNIINEYVDLKYKKIDKSDKSKLIVLKSLKTLFDKNNYLKIIIDILENPDNIKDDKIIKDDNIKNNKKSIEFNYSIYSEYVGGGFKKIKKFLRVFKYPPSIQIEKNRALAKFKYEEDINNDVKFPVHCGCHYSNIGYIYYYLMRQQPYENLLVKLQSYNLENPNRCFINIIISQNTIYLGYDNRELIPEFFSKIESFLNLNCDLFGYLELNNNIVDDCEIDDIINYKEMGYLSKFVSFILLHKKILNSKLVGYKLKKWINNIFGINQIPPLEKRKKSYNIFVKASYEQNLNLEKKLEKKLKQKEENSSLTDIQIKRSINAKLDHIINFGVTPSQLFKEEHPIFNWLNKMKNNEEINKINKSQNDKKNSENKSDNLEEEEDLETSIIGIIIPQNLCSSIEGEPIFFKTNPTINKIFVYNKENNIIMIESEAFNEIYYKYFNFGYHSQLKQSNILYTKTNPVYQIKYSFCSFDKEIQIYNDVGNYHTYFYYKINYLINEEKIQKEHEKYNFNSFKMITCRHIDFSFKIHYIEKLKRNKKK